MHISVSTAFSVMVPICFSDNQSDYLCNANNDGTIAVKLNNDILKADVVLYIIHNML